MNKSGGQTPSGWRWVDEIGKQQEISEEDLYVKLSSGELESYTLVWKPGWRRWLPAFRVASLAWALPAGQARRPVKPDPGGNEVPEPPLDLYPELKQEAEAGPSRASILDGQVTPEPVRPELGTEWDIPTSVRDISQGNFDWSAIGQAGDNADDVDDNERGWFASPNWRTRRGARPAVRSAPNPRNHRPA